MAGSRKERQMKADIGLIGLAVMGQNLVLNMNDKGFSVAVHNRTEQKTRDFLSGPAAGRDNILAAQSLEELVSLLERPRKLMLMVKAGAVVDSYIEMLLPLLEEGDIIIDGGNSHFSDSIRRHEALQEQGIRFIGAGVSGGEEGARRGPSLMPGGEASAWPVIAPIFQAIAAKTPSGAVCCDWIGSGGSGHYVKMVHNGIEYGDMQIIGEAYHFLRESLGLSNAELASVFERYNSGALNSYLIEISSAIFSTRDNEGDFLLDKILDAAGQKGTGKWTGMNALDIGVPASLIGESVFARSLSAQKEERVQASQIIEGPQKTKLQGKEKERWIGYVEQSLLASKIVSYAQGFMLLREAAKQYSWDLDYASIALIWREGCIIRSVFLDRISEAFSHNPKLSNLLLDPHFRGLIQKSQTGWRKVLAKATETGIPMPATSSALSFYDGYRCPRLPANLIQAQRDFFGAHSYERCDRPRGAFFHYDWIGDKGESASGTYQA